MHKILRPMMPVLFGVACALVSVSAVAPDAPPEPTSRPVTEGTPSGRRAEAKPPSGAASPATSQPAKPPAGTPQTQPERLQEEETGARTPPKVSAEEVLKAFQKDRPTQVPLAPSGGSDEVPSAEGAQATGASRRLPDGFFLVDRVGRVIKDGDWYVFVFEGYNESHPEPPMKLLPNQLLERMVLESEHAGSGVVFVVSGEVTEFQGENYLLLRKLLRRRNLGNLEK